MENTDALIKNITGSTNYMKEIEKITGNIESIDIQYFTDRINEISVCDECIRSLMKKLNNDETKAFFEASIKTNFKKAIITKNNKRHSKKVADIFRPKNFIKTPYFKFIKKIEKTCNGLIEDYDIDNANPSFEQVKHILSTNPDLMSTKNFFGYELANDDDVKAIIALQSSCHKIIDIFMSPMYDVKQTMYKNWGILKPMFKNDSFMYNNEIKDMLYLFVVAKYRCQLTDNNKYYTKLFMDIINKSTVDGNQDDNIFAKMDPARFLELLDNINFESISQKKSVYEFANKSKDIIRRIAEHKQGDKMEDILKDIQQVLNETNNKMDEFKEETLQTDKENESTENNDILSSI